MRARAHVNLCIPPRAKRRTRSFFLASLRGPRQAPETSAIKLNPAKNLPVMPPAKSPDAIAETSFARGEPSRSNINFISLFTGGELVRQIYVEIVVSGSRNGLQRDGTSAGYNVNVYRRDVYRYELIRGVSMRPYIYVHIGARGAVEFSDSARKGGRPS